MSNYFPWWDNKVGLAFSVDDWRTIYLALGALANEYHLWEESGQSIEEIESIASEIEKYILKF